MSSSTLTTMLGPAYSFPDAINKHNSPSKLHVSSSGSFSALGHNIKAMVSYIDVLAGTDLIGGKTGPYGDAFFIKSGLCNNKSSPECRQKDRYLYVNNIPKGLGNIGIELPGGLKGVVPGIIEDLAHIITLPVEIVQSLSGGGGGLSNVCSLRSEKVGPASNLKSVKKCSPSDKEGFELIQPESEYRPIPNRAGPVARDAGHGSGGTIIKRIVIGILIIALLYFLYGVFRNGGHFRGVIRGSRK